MRDGGVHPLRRAQLSRAVRVKGVLGVDAIACQHIGGGEAAMLQAAALSVRGHARAQVLADSGTALSGAV
jgi:hypothetical protein